jgi:hypothetical protein
VDQRRSQLNALLVAVGEVLEPRPRPVAQPEALQQRLGTPPGVPGREPVVPAEVDQLVDDAHPRVEAALLGHVPEPQACLGVNSGAAPAHLAGVWRGEAEDAAHRRGLAGPVGAEEAHETPRQRRQGGSLSAVAEP